MNIREMGVTLLACLLVSIYTLMVYTRNVKTRNSVEYPIFVRYPTSNPTPRPTSKHIPRPTPRPTQSPTPDPYLDYLAMIHIPRTSGNSFYDQHRSLYKFMFRSPGPDENSYYYYKGKVARSIRKGGKEYKLFTIFRKPETHVYSMYLECKYDKWGREMTFNTTFPRNVTEDESKGITPGFDQWLKHFVNSPNTTDMYNCYQPNNMQTRYMMTSVKYPHNFDRSSLHFNDETKKRIDSLHFFGLTEYYFLTSCVMEFLASGKMHQSCDCSNGIPNVKRKKESRITHGVPPHPFELLSDNTKAMIDQLISEDKKLYYYVEQRFWRRVWEIEHFNDIQFCYI